VAEFHGELASAGGHGAQVADVAEHGAQRGFGFDADAAASAVEVADDVADFFLRGEDV
jgi:hypothetical protein